MRVPVSWLREFVAIPSDQTARQIADRLVLAGLEVETVVTIGGEVAGPLVVGQIRQIEVLSEFKKPIRFCRVAVGAGNGEVVDGKPGDERGIICGASNFELNDLVVVALPGAVLPGGFTISTRQTYGRRSDGMITSERELGIGDDHAGIIVLPPDSSQPGESAYELLGLGEQVLDIAVTPDRGYALSVRGVAREAATAYHLPFADPALADPENVVGPPTAGFPVHDCQIRDLSGADHFVLRTVVGLDPEAASPMWMRRRLVAAGMRPVALAVDITNYVMLELGQPLHAFDRGRLNGPLQVRRAHVGESLETLDHVVRELDPTDLLIADDVRPLALAGTMGGLDSEIAASTHDVAIEAVHFDAVTIARMSRRHKLSSEASRRFERGVDPSLPPIATARAAALMCQLGGARYAGVVQVGGPSPAARIRMVADLPSRTAGLAISADQAAALLEAVGAMVRREDEGLEVTPPSWRPDLTDPADLVEEVIRVLGYQSLPSTLPRAHAGYGLSARQRQRRRVGRVLAGFGLTEIICYPFIGTPDLNILGMPDDDRRREVVRLANPISDEAPYLRTTLLPGLVAAARRNLGRGTTDLAVYEIGSVFRGSRVGLRTDPPRPSIADRPSQSELDELAELLPEQPRHLAGLMFGAAERSGWWGSGRAVCWADAVGVVRELAAELGVQLNLAAGAQAPWHPGRCAEFSLGGNTVGHAGELHPRVVAATSLPDRTCAFELDLDALLAGVADVVLAPRIATYPVAKEDLAFVVTESVTAGELGDALRQGAGELAESVRLFDVYTGPQVGPGRKSLAFALRLRAADRTLDANEVASARAGAIAAAGLRCGAKLR